MPPTDTSPQARQDQIDTWMAIDPGERLRLVIEMSEETWEIGRIGIASRHPDYEPAEVEWASRRQRLGDELFVEVWPDAPRLDP